MARRLRAWKIYIVRCFGVHDVLRPACGRRGLFESRDSLPEWSKGVDSISTSASCVGSNPTAVICSILPVCVSGGPLSSSCVPGGVLTGSRWASDWGSRGLLVGFLVGFWWASGLLHDLAWTVF